MCVVGHHLGIDYKNLLLNIHIIFLPTWTTSMVQVVDIVFNKPFKNVLDQNYYNWSTSRIAEQIRGVIIAKDYKLDLSNNSLKNESIHWLYIGWKHIIRMQSTVFEGYKKVGTFQLFEKLF